MLIAELLIQRPRYGSSPWGKRITKLRYIPTVEYYSAMKKNRILPFVTAPMGLEGVVQREIIQTWKDRHLVISLICGI